MPVALAHGHESAADPVEVIADLHADDARRRDEHPTQPRLPRRSSPRRAHPVSFENNQQRGARRCGKRTPASGDRELQPDGADPVPKRTTSPPEAMIARPVATSSAPTPRQRRSPVGRGPEEADFARARVIEPTRMSHVRSPHRSRSSTHAGESEDNSGRTLDPKALTETPSQRIRQEVVTTRR